MDSFMTALVWAVLIAVIIFFVCRELNCWYWKINDRNSLLQEIRDRLRSIDKKLGGGEESSIQDQPNKVINSKGDEEWRLDGKLHRIDGPAYIHHPGHDDGYKAWYLYGELHRTDGPAIVYSNGEERWYLNGKEIYGKELSSYKESVEQRLKKENHEEERKTDEELH